MTKDLTQGSPVRLILGFALPLLAGMLFQQLYNLVVTLIVGRFLGMEALAGVGATGSINFLVLGFCMGVCSGFAIPVAQQFGAREESRMREFVANGTWLSIVFALVMTVLTVVYCGDILRVIDFGQKANRAYLDWCRETRAYFEQKQARLRETQTITNEKQRALSRKTTKE